MPGEALPKLWMFIHFFERVRSSVLVLVSQLPSGGLHFSDAKGIWLRGVLFHRSKFVVIKVLIQPKPS